MKFYLVFNPSGDVIPLSTDKSDLLEYFIDFLEKHGANKFNPTSNNKFVRPTQLHQILYKFNHSIVGQLMSFACANDELQLLDQNLLNEIHCQWVHSNHVRFRVSDLQQKYPMLQHLFDQISDDIDTVSFPEICYKYNLQDLYFSINYHVHEVESMFNKMHFRATCDREYNWIEIKNVFPKSYTSNSVSNLSLSFAHYGRTLYDKFRTFDLDLTHDDENSFDQLLGFVNISLVPPETITYSPEYLEWCKKINREPGGTNINIGNILELETKLLHYRNLFYKNLVTSNNHFQLSI